MFYPNRSLFHRARFARLAASSAVLATALSLPAQISPNAASPTDGIVTLEKVVTLGSRFADRTVVNSPVPIDVFTEREIRDTGYTELGQVLQSQVPSLAFPRSTNVAGTALQRPATLRGLSPDQTLVLLNGKRRNSSAIVHTNGSVGRGSSPVDLNAIPTFAIGGAEILRDGAAAQYGSDAIAGVINFQLRRNLGAEVTTSFGRYYEGDGEALETSFNFGLPVGNRGGFINTTLYYSDRGWTKRTRPDLQQYYFGLNAAGQPVQWRASGAILPTPPAPATHYDPREATVDRMQARWGDPESEGRGVFINAEIPVAKNTRWYGFGGYSLRDSIVASSFTRPGADNNIRALFPDGYLSGIIGEIEDASFATGLKGNLGAWDWDVSETWGRNVVNYWSDSVNPSYGLASPTHFYVGELFFQQATTNLDLTRSFDIGRAHPLEFAVGAEFRWENYRITRGEDASWRDGGQPILDGPNAGKPAAVGAGFPGFRPTDETDAKRHNVAVYLDTEHKLTDAWLVGLALRAEDYSDAGSSVTGKVATRYELSPRFAVRGSASTGFRAPGLGQSAYTKTQQFGNTAGSNRTTAVVKTFPVDSAVAQALGAKPLRPEESTNFSGGFTAQLTKNLSLSLDAYYITIKDQIVLSSNLIGLLGTTYLEDFIAATDPLSRGVEGASFFLNGIDSEARGVDFTTRYRWEITPGQKLTFTFALNLNRNKVTDEAATPALVGQLVARDQTLFDVSQKTIFENGTPRVKGVFSATYDLGKKWTLVFREAYYHKTRAINASTGSTTQVYSPKWLTDLDLTYKITPKFSVTVGANNVFDVYPDLIEGAVGARHYDQALAPFGFNGGYYFGRLNYRF